MFEDKLKTIQQQHEIEINKYKQKIQETEGLHFEEIKQIRENNSRVIDEIKYEYSTLLENIKVAKKSESTLFEESNTYLQKLDSNIEVLYANSKRLGDLKDHIENDYGILSKAREESLKGKEQEIICNFFYYNYRLNIVLLLRLKNSISYLIYNLFIQQK